MIDLTQTRESMLEALAASPGALPTVLDGDDPRIGARDESRLEFVACSHDEVLPSLRTVLSQRFSDVSPERLAEVLHLLKKGLGNAEKRGNRGDLSKRVRLEAVITRRGALLSVCDEGPGFDVHAVLARRRRGERYFTHGGSGLRTFEKAGALVSYADGGRTLLVCFRRDPLPGRAPAPDECGALGPLADPTQMGAALAAALGAERRTTFELCACRISMAPERDVAPELRYELELRGGTPPVETRIVRIGRALSASAARTELAVARHLSQEGLSSSGVRVPRPRVLSGHPNLVLYEFDPVCDLRGHLAAELPPAETEAVVRRVASGLRALHESTVAGERVADRDDLLASWGATAQRIARRLADAHDERAVRVDRLFGALQERAAAVSWDALVPIHGAFGFDSLWHDGSALNFYRFDRSHHSHPGVDVGAFLADLMRFHRLRRDRDRERYEVLREQFLATYPGAASAPHPEDLAAFVTGALLQRLERLLRRPREKWQHKIERLIQLGEEELAGAETGIGC